MLKLSSYTIARRLAILTLSAVLGIIILAIMFLVSENRLIMEEQENGVRQTVEAAHGAGFVSYMWSKSGMDKPAPKVSFVKGFAPWGWIIGSGVSVDTVDSVIAGRTWGFARGSLALAVLLLAIGWLIARGILKQLGSEPAYAADITHRIAEGDPSVNIVVNDPSQPRLQRHRPDWRPTRAQRPSPAPSQHPLRVAMTTGKPFNNF